MLDVVALGELLIDFTCKGQNTQGYPLMEAHPGGAPANFLAAMAKLGAKTALLGKVGDDAFGKLLADTLAKVGIDISGLLIDKNVFTTLAFVTLDASGDREFSFARKPGADTCICKEELNLSLIEKAKVFHFGTLSLTNEPARSATQYAVAFAKSKQKLITFDPNLRKPLWDDLNAAKEQMLWGLEQADVVKISDEEVAFLFDMKPEDGAKYIVSHYPVKLVFVTCGADGCYFNNGNAFGHVPALKNVKVVDTTGAGDVFGGSSVWKLLQSGKAPDKLDELELRDIVTFASAAAGLSTMQPGGFSSVPEYEQILQTVALVKD